jgi:hypothetical protein
VGSGAAAGWAIGVGGTMGADLAGTKAEAGMTGEPVAADAVRDISVPGPVGAFMRPTDRRPPTDRTGLVRSGPALLSDC